MTEKERMLAGKLFNPTKIDDGAWEKSRDALEIFNNLSWKEQDKGHEVLKSIFGHLDDNAFIVAPFYCDKGNNIYINGFFYANTGLVILDEADVNIGNYVLLGPHVSIYTVGHPLDVDVRNAMMEIAKPVTIKDNVWIGGNTTINPGVTIGENTTIGSGSVVTKDIPANVLAAGNPCRVIREISEKDHEYWKELYQDYLNDTKSSK